MIPTRTRLRYANGYLELGMINEAAEEIDYIMGEDRMSLQVMRMRMKMYKQAEYWPALEAVSKFVANQAPSKPEGWLNWSNALRELDKSLQKASVDNPDLDRLWEEIASIE
jgi:hypothetical protein